MDSSNLLTVDDLLALPKVNPQVELRYGSDASQFGHLYLPNKSSSLASNTSLLYPVVVLVHGGCWRARVSLDYFGQAAQALSHLGVAVWSLEYRRLGNGGGWPTTFLDVAAGTDYLKELALKYPLDLSKVVAIGHSAGGHLVSWLAARANLPTTSELYVNQPLALQGLISIAGIPDLVDALKYSICQEAPRELIGGLPDVLSERYQHGSPAELAPCPAKQVFVQGEQDEIVPLAYIQSYVNAAKKRGETLKLIALANTGHFEPVIASTNQWQAIEQNLLEILEL